jgi:hypothetical protein
MSSGKLVASVQRLLSLDVVGYRCTEQNCARMADVDLAPMDLELLPPIAHASAEGGDPPPHPETFKAVTNLEGLIRPDTGCGVPLSLPGRLRVPRPQPPGPSGA